MDSFYTKLKLVLADSSLRMRLLFVLGAFALFRLGASIPIPGVNTDALTSFLSGNQFLGLLNIFSGGGLSNLSILMLGVGPYITASIIMQLLTMIFPAVKEMYQEEGEAGRRKMAQYSRLLTVPLAALQAFSLLMILEQQGIFVDVTMVDRLLNVLVVVAGAIFLMWLGELITEYGIGNGMSLIIFAGIVSSLPSNLSRVLLTFDLASLPIYLGFAVLGIIVIAGIVFITEAERPIPVTYARQMRGGSSYGGSSSYLPIRVNNAGVMPIIFALSILLFPQLLANFMKITNNAFLVGIADSITTTLANQLVYGALYFVLVIVFTYFYSAVTFDPKKMAENLQKGGAFIPGIRPGAATVDYVGTILMRLTFIGALFLAVVAVLPIIMQEVTGIATLTLGGTSLLIVVSVAIDFVKKLSAQATMREY
jgi:preprotein translocase subunit SecY